MCVFCVFVLLLHMYVCSLFCMVVCTVYILYIGIYMYIHLCMPVLSIYINLLNVGTNLYRSYEFEYVLFTLHVKIIEAYFTCPRLLHEILFH